MQPCVNNEFVTNPRYGNKHYAFRGHGLSLRRTGRASAGVATKGFRLVCINAHSTEVYCTNRENSSLFNYIICCKNENSTKRWINSISERSEERRVGKESK